MTPLPALEPHRREDPVDPTALLARAEQLLTGRQQPTFSMVCAMVRELAACVRTLQEQVETERIVSASREGTRNIDIAVIGRLTDKLDAVKARVQALEGQGWQPIETAPKEFDSTGITQRIILGFAPDEEDYTSPSCEGYWRSDGWVSSLDAFTPVAYLQPTHWRPLPAPPRREER